MSINLRFENVQSLKPGLTLGEILIGEAQDVIYVSVILQMDQY